MPPFPVFVINLKRDAERLTFMQRQLEKINIPFEVIPGIDGDAIPRRQLEKMYDPAPAMRNGRRLHPGEIGCCLSHIKAWRTMLEKDLPAALILEDDVLLAEDFPEILRNLRLPEQCQALQLISGHELDTVRNRVFSPYGAMSLPNGWKMACHLGESYGMLAYIIRQPLARRLVREENRIQAPIDSLLFSWKYNFHPPWVVYKKEKRGVYATLGEEKRDLGPRSLQNDQKRRTIAERIKNGMTDRSCPATDSAEEENLPVLLINLKKDSQRLAAMQRRFDAIDLSFETTEAVDGKRIPAETMNKIYDGKRARRNIERELSPAEIGRGLSHIKAWRALLDKGAPAAAVVEDNAVLDDDFPKFLRYSCDPKKSSGGRAKRGVFRTVTHLFRPPPPIPLPHDYRPPDDEEIKKLKAGEAVRRFQTQAYIIHRSQARRLLRKGRRIQRPIDDLLFCKEISAKERVLEWCKERLRDATALFNAHILCRIFPPTRANKLSLLECDDASGAGVRQNFKIMLSCYALSSPFGLNLNKRKTNAPASE